jgi:hypothetical protein
VRLTVAVLWLFMQRDILSNVQNSATGQAHQTLRDDGESWGNDHSLSPLPKYTIKNRICRLDLLPDDPWIYHAPTHRMPFFIQFLSKIMKI